jgi:hypothetical protein
VNSLSWLLYFAEISTNISSFAFVMMILSAIVSVSLTLAIMTSNKNDMPDMFVENGPRIRNIASWVFLISTLGLLFPSQNTVYLIIASESASTIVTSESGQKMINDIQNIVSLKLDNIADDLIIKPKPTNN